MGLAMETICTFFLNYGHGLVAFARVLLRRYHAWRRGFSHLISRLFIMATSCLWVIYVYRYQIAVGLARARCE